MTFGLIGYPLTHSFSQEYFARKFAMLALSDSHRYYNFPLEDIAEFPAVLRRYEDLRGLNVTLPHKQAVLPFLDELDPAAAAIGAVNTILVADGKLKGFNTDVIGFRDDFLDFAGASAVSNAAPGLGKMPAPAEPKPTSRTDFTGWRALVLGSGGASLAVHYCLRELGVITTTVSRSPGTDRITYAELDAATLGAHRIVVNTTPLGMYPAVEGRPELPYAAFGAQHYCYDLVYNPAETSFLRMAATYGAKTRSGLGMLHGQAEAAWRIWTGGESPQNLSS